MPFLHHATSTEDSTMPDFITRQQDDINTRMKELTPGVDEYRRLAKALRALTGPLEPTRKIRRLGGGKRGEEALDLIIEQPGITIRQMSEQISVRRTYLYEVLSGLQSRGKVRKDGLYWYPVEV
jgi:hypothetical protein